MLGPSISHPVYSKKARRIKIAKNNSITRPITRAIFGKTSRKIVLFLPKKQNQISEYASEHPKVFNYGDGGRSPNSVSNASPPRRRGDGEGRAPARQRLEQGMVRIKPLFKERISADSDIILPGAASILIRNRKETTRNGLDSVFSIRS